VGHCQIPACSSKHAYTHLIQGDRQLYPLGQSPQNLRISGSRILRKDLLLLEMCFLDYILINLGAVDMYITNLTEFRLKFSLFS